MTHFTSEFPHTVTPFFLLLHLITGRVLDLLDKYVDVNVYDEKTGMTALMVAAKQVQILFPQRRPLLFFFNTKPLLVSFNRVTKLSSTSYCCMRWTFTSRMLES